MTGKAKTVQTELITQLEDVLVRAEAEWPDNPARLNQLRSHLETSKMVVDHLATEVPYVQGA